MKTRPTLRPGQNGTRKLLQKYGDRLLVVRYCYDARLQKRFKDCELIEEGLPWQLSWSPGKPGDPVLVRIGYGKAPLRAQAKQAGAIWQPTTKLWKLDYATAQRLRLVGRIVE